MMKVQNPWAGVKGWQDGRVSDAATSETEPTPGRVIDCSDPGQVDAAVAAAVEAVRAGHCIVIPTDTVYGIGADAFLGSAVQSLLKAKGRGRDMPPPVLVADPSVLMALGREIPDNAKKLAERFWPGALTLIVPAQTSLRIDLGDTAGTIAVRVPDHDIARQVLRGTGPLAVSSANRTGEPSATTAAHAREQLGDRVAVYLDAGSTPGQVPSTIVDFTKSEYGSVVRAGKIPVSALREVIPYLEENIAPVPPVASAPGDAITAPAPGDAITAPAPGDARTASASGAPEPEDSAASEAGTG